MSRRAIFTAITAAAFVAAPALAQCVKNAADRQSETASAKQHATCEKSAKQAGTCSMHSTADAGADCAVAKSGACHGSDCAGDFVRFKGVELPAIAYEVNGEQVKCPKSAAKLAKDSGAQIKYVLGDKVFTDESEAMTAYADVLNDYLDEILTVKYGVGDKSAGCCKSAEALAKNENDKVTYRLASFGFEDRDSAQKAAKLAREAAEKVELKMMVGDRVFSCPLHACGAAMTAGVKVDYCVGEFRTSCQTTARIRLATERINAALAACEDCGGKQLASASP